MAKMVLCVVYLVPVNAWWAVQKVTGFMVSEKVWNLILAMLKFLVGNRNTTEDKRFQILLPIPLSELKRQISEKVLGL